MKRLKKTSEYEILKTKFDIERKIASGEVFDFNLPTPKGDSISLSSLKGKVVIVDFWASWCVWCRKETPNLKKQYAKYKEHGLEIVSISFDTDEKKWRHAMEEDDMPWLQAWDNRGVKDSKITQSYGVSSIPYIFIVNKEGKLVANNVRQPSIADDDSKNINIQLEKIFGF